jgi:hypothetical protein
VGRVPRRRPWLVAGAAGAALAALVAVLVRPQLVHAATDHVPLLSVLTLEAWLATVTWKPVRRLLRGLALRDLLWVEGIAGVLLLVLLTPGPSPLPLDRAVLAAVVPPACLVPVVTGLAVVAWPRLDRSKHVLLRAGADIVLSILLGLDVLLALVVAANLAGLTPQQVAGARAWLERLKVVSDVPTAVWFSLYAGLAAVGLAMVLWPRAMESTERWWATIRLLPSLATGKRTITVAHIALLVSTLLGVAAPDALEPTVRAHLRSAYALALHDQLDAQGRAAAYASIQASAAAPTTPAQAPRQSMAAMFVHVREVAHRQASGTRVRDIEQDLAWRIGGLQGRWAVRGTAAPPLSSDPAKASLHRFDGPVASPAELEARVGEVADRQEEGSRAREALRRVTELAAATLANAVFLPGLGDIELLQIVQEYLSGIVESSPAADVFFQAAERRWFHEPPARERPTGVTLVVVDVAPLRFLAANVEVFARLESPPPAAEVATLDRSEQGWRGEPAELAIVEYVNETRVLEQSGTCVVCAYHGRPGSAEEARAREARSSGGAAGPGRAPAEPRPVEPHPFR